MRKKTAHLTKQTSTILEGQSRSRLRSFDEKDGTPKEVSIVNTSSTGRLNESGVGRKKGSFRFGSKRHSVLFQKGNLKGLKPKQVVMNAISKLNLAHTGVDK